jgi:hypothetical protein
MVQCSNHSDIVQPAIRRDGVQPSAIQIARL